MEARESCGIDEIAEDLRKTTGNLTISLHSILEMLCMMNSVVFRRATKSRHLRVYPSPDGAMMRKVVKFQRDHDDNRVPEILPPVVLKAMWSVPPSEALVAMRYRHTAGPGMHYDTSKDCPPEWRKFPNEEIG